MDNSIGRRTVSGICGVSVPGMRTLNVFFYLSLFIFFSILILKHFAVPLPTWIYSYVNDFLCMPVVLTICLKTVHFIKKNYSIRLPLSLVVTLTSFYAIYFEYYMPLVEPRYTADMLDVVMYFAGAGIIYVLQFRK